MKKGYNFVVSAKAKPIKFSRINIEYYINAESEEEARKILASKERERYLDTYEFYPDDASTPEILEENIKDARLIYVGEPSILIGESGE